MERDLNCTKFQATLGVSLYALGFGIVPLVTASFSEEFGRQPLYLWSGVGFLLFTIATALCVLDSLSALLFFDVYAEAKISRPFWSLGSSPVPLDLQARPWSAVQWPTSSLPMSALRPSVHFGDY